MGHEASAVRQMLDIKYPLAEGIVKNWEDMEILWDYTFSEKLKINPKDCKILLTEACRYGEREPRCSTEVEDPRCWSRGGRSCRSTGPRTGF